MEELRSLVKDGAFEEGEARVISPTFLIPKKDGTRRLIHDLRGVNKHLTPPHFTLHGARDAGEVVRNSEWLAVLDLRHGYQQVAMDPHAREFLGAQLGDKTIVSTVLPFGLNLSPYVFTRLTGWLGREIRRRFGLQVAVYIDDFLLGAASRLELEEGIQKVKEFFEILGVVISTKKEVLPARTVEFIGFDWDAEHKAVRVPEKRRREYRRAVKNLLRHAQTRATWRRVIGKLGFLKEAVGPTMRHVRSLLHAVAKRREKGSLLEAQGEAKEDLQWWAKKLEAETELSLKTVPVTGCITTDASDVGLGFLISLEKEGCPGGRLRFERGAKVGAPEDHINKKEIEAVHRALVEHKGQLQGRKVIWYSDSITAVAAIGKQGTQNLSAGTWDATKKVLDLAEEEAITLLPRHVPGRLNAAADALSRQGEYRNEWEVALEKVTRRWGPLEEDPCGATGEATCILEGLGWTERRTLLFPKVGEIEEVMRHLELGAAEEVPRGDPATWKQMGVVITPLWKGAIWWPTLTKLRVDYMSLGRWSTEDTKGWELRNGHPPEWTASLVPLETHCGQSGQERNIEGRFSGSSPGRRERA